MKYSVLYIVISLILGNKAFCQQLPAKQFNKADYLETESFNDICQSKNLLLYFATDQGILTYDGYVFRFLEAPSNKELRSNIRSIEIADSVLYFISQKGLQKYNLLSGTLETIHEGDLYELSLVGNILYYHSKTNLYGYDLTSHSPSKIVFESPASIHGYLIDKNRVLIATENGIYDQLQNSKATLHGSFLSGIEINKINEGDYLVAGVLKDGTFALFNYNKDGFSQELSLGDLEISDLYFSEQGDTWISSKAGELVIYNGLRTRRYFNDKNIYDFGINKLEQDKEGNLWLLGKYGLAYIDINSPSTIIVIADIEHINLSNNELLILSDEKIIIQSATKDQLEIAHNLNIRDKQIASYYQNRKWHIQLGEDEYIVENGQLFKSNFTGGKTLSLNDHVFNLTKNKLEITNGDPYRNEPAQSLELLYNEYWFDDSYLYVNTADNNYARVNSNAEVEEFKLAIPRSSTLKFQNNFAYDFNDTIIYIQSMSGEPAKINLKKEIGIDKIFNVHLSNEENLWVSTTNYLYKLNFNIEGRSINIINVDTYDQSDYFLSTYFYDALSFNNSVYLLHDNGISVYNNLLNSTNLVPPGIKIISAKGYSLDQFSNVVDTFDLDSKADIVLPPHHNIKVKAYVISFDNNKTSKILYRVSDLNDDFKSVKNGETIFLNNLSSGAHTLEFKSVNSDGIESEAIKSISFKVAKPFYLQLWFFGLLIFIIAVIAYIIYRSVISFKDSKSKELHDRLDKELSELEKRSHLQILKAERLKQLNELITSQKSELEKKNIQIESQKYELSLTNQQIKKQKDLLEETSSKLKASINYAQRIQDALMSTEIEIKEAIDASFVFFQPRDVVSGDFYWFYQFTNEKNEELQILAAVDCTGHGVPGAIVSVVGMNLLNNITKLKKIHDPGEILTELNKDIVDNLRQNETQVNDGMDMTLVSINNTTKEVKFAGAKNPLMYVENGELIRIRGDKHAIGGQQRGDERKFTTHTIESNGQERMFYLFSDGYQDQFGGEKGFKFLTSNFKNLLLDIHHKPVIDQKEILYKTINKWKGDYSQTDDMLVIGFRF